MADNTFGAIAGSWSEGAKWSLAHVPDNTEDAVFGALSASCIIDAGAVAKSLNCTGYPSTMSGSAALTLSGNLTAGGTWTYTGTITYNAAATITSNGKNVGNMTIDASGALVQLADAWGFGTIRNITLTQGTFDPKGKAINCSAFANATGTSALDFTTAGATINCFSFNLSAATCTVTSNDEIITASGAIGTTFSGGSKTYYDVRLTATGTFRPRVSGSNIFTKFTRSGGNRLELGYGATQTIAANGFLTLTGPTAESRLLVDSASSTVSATFSIPNTATVSVTDCDFRRITVSGTGSPLAGTRLGDRNSNSGITFTTAANKYAVCGTADANWNDVIWATSSGGATSINNYPLPQDTAFIDDATWTDAAATAHTLTANAPNGYLPGVNCASLTDTNKTLAFTTACQVFNDLVASAVLNISGTVTLTCNKNGTLNITTAGCTAGAGWTNNFLVDGLGYATVVVSCVDNLIMSPTATLTLGSNKGGTFTANNQNVTLGAFSSSNTQTRTFTMGTTNTWTFTGTGAVFNIATIANLTFTATTAAIVINDNSTSTKLFSGGGKTFGNLTAAHGNTGTVTLENATFAALAVTGTAGKVILGSAVGNVSCTTFTPNPDALIEFYSGGTLTVASAAGVVMNGTAGHLITVTATTPTSHGHLVIAAGTIEVTFCSIKDNEASGGASFIASISNGNIDVSGNSGWNFAATGGGIIPLAMHHYKMLRG